LSPTSFDHLEPREWRRLALRSVLRIVATTAGLIAITP